jgi:AcrR family transcriptional regulator
MAAMVEPPVKRKRPEMARLAVIAAARACYAEKGVEATRMEDVARRAGVSRQHVYSLVASRSQLLELATLERLDELGAQLAERPLDDGRDVAELIIDQIVAGIRLGREDPEFTRLAESMPRVRLNHILTSRDSPLHRINTRAFAAIFARAMAEERLRTDVGADSMIEWLQGIMALLAGRDDLDEHRQREMLRDYVLPGVLS